MVENQKRKPGYKGLFCMDSEEGEEEGEERISSDHTVILNRSKTAGLGHLNP